MAIDRRELLAGATALTAASLLGGELRAYARDKELFLSSVRRGLSSYALFILDEQGRILRELPLAERGHDVAVHGQTDRGVVFARRPGTFAVAFDLSSRTDPTVFQSPDNRHFYGHGVFSPDGRLLFTTENDFENARGVIGVYDVDSGYRRIGEFDSHGVGPHDLLQSPDGQTLVVANGGIETHPEAGRAKLNVASMQPSLVFLNRLTGDVKARHTLAKTHHKLSIRHLSLDATGAVWFGGQWEGGLDVTPSLVGSATLDQPISLVSAGTPISSELKGYIGSVATSREGRLLAASAPRANRVIYIDTLTRRVVAETTLKDGCGVAPTSGTGFMLSSGTGELARGPQTTSGSMARHEGIAFDNHMVSLKVSVPASRR